MRNPATGLLVWLLVAMPAFANPITAHVVGVTDGDTIKVLMADHQLLKIRLAGIDCPEKSQAFGARAKQLTSDLVFDQDVSIESHGHDRYGRTIGDVETAAGKSLNYELVRQGYAWWYRKYSKDAELGQLEKQAREHKLGLWSDANAQAPWEFRKFHRGHHTNN